MELTAYRHNSLHNTRYSKAMSIIASCGQEELAVVSALVALNRQLSAGPVKISNIAEPLFNFPVRDVVGPWSTLYCRKAAS